LLGTLLNENGKRDIGIEIGVLKGEFAEQVLRKWTNCKKYVLVDIWAPLENYLD